MQGGFGAGNILASALGVEDPMLQQLSAVQGIIKDVNPNDPSSLMAAAQKLAPVAPQQAQQLAAQAMTAQEKLSKIAKERAQTVSEGIIGKLLQSGKYTGESIAKFQETGNSADLEQIDKTSKPSADWLAAAGELGLKPSSTFGGYSKEEIAAVNQKVLQNKAAVASAGRATTVFQQESAFAKTLGEAQAKKLDAATEQATVSQDALSRLSQMKKLNDSGTLYQGPQANASVTTANLLNSLGLLSKDEAGKLSNSEVYSKLAKDLVMKDLGGKLGAQVSNADRDYIEARIPQLTTSPAARTELINKLQEIHAKNINYARRMQTYAEKKGSLQGFDFIEGAPATATPSVGTKENPIVLK